MELLVKLKLKRENPIIIGITGSFGKTSTKDAVYEVLKTRWSVYKNPKSLNTEIGLLLAVLEQPSGFSSAAKWLKILAGAVKNALRKKKYDFYVLEYGADKPGDIEHLAKLVKPHIGIITHIGRAHQSEGQFKNEEDVFAEKKKLVERLGGTDIAILNESDFYLKSLKSKLKAKTFWFNGGDIFAEQLKQTERGFEAIISTPNNKIHAHFEIAGAYHINVILPALLCGILNGVTMEEGISSLKHFRLPPGRMSVIEGKNDSVILDSSYNASPAAMEQALETLKSFPGKRKIAVLGSMNELGDYAAAAHKKIGHKIGVWVDLLVTVGDLAKIIADEALKWGFPRARIKPFATAEETGEFLLAEAKLSKDNVILFKGSQNRVRLEKAVKMIMAHPHDAKKLLCRQEEEWERIE